MCVDDFDYLYEDLVPRVWEPGWGACDCGADLTGRIVTRWQCGEDTYELCPVARRSALDQSELADPGHNLCGACDRWGNRLIIHERIVCDRCTAAARLLDDWCDGHYEIDGIAQQLFEHWKADSLYRSLPFGRIVWTSGNGWKTRGGADVPLANVTAWVEQAAAVVNGRRSDLYRLAATRMRQVRAVMQFSLDKERD